MLTSDFDYSLPPSLIASEPLPNRTDSKMMVLDVRTQSITHAHFHQLPTYLSPDHFLILNNTKVVPARFLNPTLNTEILRLEKIQPLLWRCMIRPGKKFKLHSTHSIGNATGSVVQILDNGERLIQFDQPVDESRHGELPLPHYMEREFKESDRDRYQTVYAQHEGAIAAPTAGLHFNDDMLAKLPHAYLTLHVGLGTFQPVKAAHITEHQMHSEQYHLSSSTAKAIQDAKKILAIGTTSMRTLETIGRQLRLQYSDSTEPIKKHIQAVSGATDIFITPGFQFEICDALLTNFHLPKSTLMMLVSAFAGYDFIRKAYQEAIDKKYRFYSYGDCMLILK
jgi:S-adenosylmethionine:tRNA ribosyltransferase-isomerase